MEKFQGARALLARYVAIPFAGLLALAGVARGDKPPVTPPGAGGFQIHGYGVANYFAFDWQTDPSRRNAIDLERLALYPVVGLSGRVRLNGEMEIEHGGTGATLEFDPLEEFGEFEMEVEKGGEVQLEQMNVEVMLGRALSLKLGRFKLPFALNAVDDEPAEYFTTTRSETEASLVPTNWYENGVQATGLLDSTLGLTGTLSLTNGLDSSGFSSASWIVRGHQERFETVVADAPALSGRLDAAPVGGLRLGGSFYTGDTAANRPKRDLEVSARVILFDLHLSVERGPFVFRGLYLGGTLENADLVSRANRNLSNNLNVKRTPVGHRAEGWVLEAAVDLRRVLQRPGPPLRLFARGEAYDTMAAVTGDVFDNPRWDRSVLTGGLNVHLNAPVVLKAQYSLRRLGTATNNRENTFSTGFGFEF